MPRVDISKSLSSYLRNFLRRPLFRNPSCSNFVPSAREARELFTEFPKSEPRPWPRHSSHFRPLKHNPKQWMPWARSMVRGTNETSSIFRLLFLPSSFPRPSSPEWKLCQSLSVLSLMSGEGTKKKDSNEGRSLVRSKVPFPTSFPLRSSDIHLGAGKKAEVVAVF